MIKQLKTKLKNIGKKVRSGYLYIVRYKYINDIRKMIGEDVTIISSNCLGGHILQDLNREYNTPTVGLYIWAPDYIEFVKNLKHYLTEAELKFVESSKYPIGNERRKAWPHWYPIAILDEKVEIHFLHYHSEEEARNKWNRRKSRVNLDNLFIIGMDQNLCTEREVQLFDELSYERKIMFSRFPITKSSNEYMPEFIKEDAVGNPVLKGHLFYKHLVRHFKKLS